MSDSQGHDPSAVLDHFLNARNVGDFPDADAVGEVGAVECGDILRICLKVRDGRITDARFRAYGCGTAIACASVTTELLRGRTMEEAKCFTNDEVAKALGGVPATKAHCPVLAEEAVKAAVADYAARATSSPRE